MATNHLGWYLWREMRAEEEETDAPAEMYVGGMGQTSGQTGCHWPRWVGRPTVAKAGLERRAEQTRWRRPETKMELTGGGGTGRRRYGDGLTTWRAAGLRQTGRGGRVQVGWWRWGSATPLAWWSLAVNWGTPRRPLGQCWWGARRPAQVRQCF